MYVQTMRIVYYRLFCWLKFADDFDDVLVMYSLKSAGLVICAVIVWFVSFLNVIVIAVDDDNYDVVVVAAVAADDVDVVAVVVFVD